MPKNDELFFNDMVIADAALRAAVHENLVVMGVFQYDASDRGMIEWQLGRFRDYFNVFRELGRISGGTGPVIEQIKLEIRPRLQRYGLDNNEGPIQVIRSKLEEWRGPQGSASYQFKNEYLPRLATSLENQYSTMRAMAAVMETHEAIVDQARQKYLDLIDNTTAAIGKNTSERGSSGAQLVVAVVSAIGTGFTIGGVVGGAVGGVIGSVFGVIQGIGGAIDATSSEPSGDDLVNIVSDALDKLKAVVTAVEEETQSVEKAVDEVLAYVDGKFRDQFLAPPVNLGPPAPDEGWG